MASPQARQAPGIEALDVEQLGQAKKQMDEELEHLTTSFAQLQAAQAKFNECLGVVQRRDTPRTDDNPILVPLTNSLYIRGTLTRPDTVLVDVGTGFLLEKSAASAMDFYTSKVQELETNIHDLGLIIQRKTAETRFVEDQIRQKMVAE